MPAPTARKVNWFAIITSVAVAVVLVVVGGIVIAVNQNKSSGGTSPASAIVNAETGAIAVGSGPRQLDTYVDFMCPVCNRFEQAYGPTIQSELDAGTITLNIHPISILDRASQGTQYSTRSASAAYCVAESDPAAVQPFVAAMYANQPQEGTGGLTNDQIVQIARNAGATGADACITEERYKDYVTAKTKATPLQPGSSGIGTPTVVIDGQVLALTGDPAADISARVR